MKPELKELMEELQVAFNESVCESDRIATVLAEIKSYGYDVLLALEVTIGVAESKKDAVFANEPVLQHSRISSGKFELTAEDEAFLHSLKIGA